MQRDSIANTFVVATVVCLACSFLVSSAAVGLRSRQNENIEIDRKKNILIAAGFQGEEIDTSEKVAALFSERFKPILIELATGDQITEDAAKNELGFATLDDAIAKYDQIKTAKAKTEGITSKFEDRNQDIAGLSSVEKYSHVYCLNNDEGQVEKYVFPIRGRGLWSTLKGFIAVENDFQTICGLTYYEHAETPGLGGEVDNVNWKNQWPGKKIFEGDEVAIQVVKGIADDDYGVDGLSGATITSKGVTNMLKYWLGESGFGPFIDKQKGNSSVSKKKTGSEMNHG